MIICYSLNVCVPPNLYADILTPKDDGMLGNGVFGSCLSHEGGVLRNGVLSW